MAAFAAMTLREVLAWAQELGRGVGDSAVPRFVMAESGFASLRQVPPAFAAMTLRGGAVARQK